MEKKELNLENVIEFINTCDEFKEIKKCDRIRRYVNSIQDELQDEIERLQDDVRDLEDECEPSFDKAIEFIQNADKRDLNSIKEELNDNLDEPIFISNNLYDNDKMQILLTAFNKYSLDELMEKLQITWSDVIL